MVAPEDVIVVTLYPKLYTNHLQKLQVCLSKLANGPSFGSIQESDFVINRTGVSRQQFLLHFNWDSRKPIIQCISTSNPVTIQYKSGESKKVLPGKTDNLFHESTLEFGDVILIDFLVGSNAS